MNKSVVLKISVTSQASEAAVIDHLESIVRDIERIRFDDWRRRIYTDWDDQYEAEIEIERIEDKES